MAYRESIPSVDCRANAAESTVVNRLLHSELCSVIIHCIPIYKTRVSVHPRHLHLVIIALPFLIYLSHSGVSMYGVARKALVQQKKRRKRKEQSQVEGVGKEAVEMEIVTKESEQKKVTFVPNDLSYKRDFQWIGWGEYNSRGPGIVVSPKSGRSRMEQQIYFCKYKKCLFPNHWGGCESSEHYYFWLFYALFHLP